MYASRCNQKSVHGKSSHGSLKKSQCMGDLRLLTQKTITWLFVRFGRVFAFSPWRKEAKWFFSFMAFTWREREMLNFKEEKCLYRCFLAGVHKQCQVCKREKRVVWQLRPRSISDTSRRHLQTWIGNCALKYIQRRSFFDFSFHVLVHLIAHKICIFW